MKWYIVLFMTCLWWNVTDARTGCHICGTRGNTALAFPKETCVEFGAGRNCLNVALDIAKLDLTSTECANAQRKYAACCNNVLDLHCVEKSNLIVTPVGPDTPKPTYVGPYKICSICKNGNYPSKNNQVINMLYIGAGTCKTYWYHGFQGKIPNHLCDPVQFFLRDICGC